MQNTNQFKYTLFHTNNGNLQQIILVTTQTAMIASHEEGQTRATKVTNYMRLLSGIVMGSIIGSPILVIIAYIFLKNIDDYKKIPQNIQQQLQKINIILLGALFGTLTGFVFVPILLIFIIKVVDDRLSLPAGSTQFREFNQKYLLSISEIVLGVIIGLLLNFLDLWLLHFCTAIFSIFLFSVIQGSKLQKSSQQANRADPQNAIKAKEEYSEIQYFQNILFASILSFHYPFFCFWSCCVHICYFVYTKISKKAFNSTDKGSILSKKDSINQIQEQLQCLISTQTMKAPTFLKQCGHTFEGVSIQEWLTKRKACPACNSISTSESIKPNILLTQFMTKWKRLNKLNAYSMKSQ